MKTLSMDLRERILASYDAKEGTRPIPFGAAIAVGSIARVGVDEKVSRWISGLRGVGVGAHPGLCADRPSPIPDIESVASAVRFSGFWKRPVS